MKCLQELSWEGISFYQDSLKWDNVLEFQHIVSVGRVECNNNTFILVSDTVFVFLSADLATVSNICPSLIHSHNAHFIFCLMIGLLEKIIPNVHFIKHNLVSCLICRGSC